MLIFPESALSLKRFLAQTLLSQLARSMLVRMSLAFRQECVGRELKYLADRLEPVGIHKIKRVLAAALPPEFRGAA